MFLRYLDPNIAKKVELQPYWTFEDMSKLAMKVKKHSKNKRPSSSSYSPPNLMLCSILPQRPKPYLRKIKAK